MTISIISVKDTQSLNTLVFCFISLTAAEATVLLGVFTNLTLFLRWLDVAVKLLTQICIFPIICSPPFLLVFFCLF